MLSTGRLWEALGGSGRLWEAVGGSGRLWEALGGSARLWEALGGSWRLWEALGGSGKLWEALGGSGSKKCDDRYGDRDIGFIRGGRNATTVTRIVTLDPSGSIILTTLTSDRGIKAEGNNFTTLRGSWRWINPESQRAILSRQLRGS